MKWKLSAFREPFKAHKVGEEASELRPDMGPQKPGKTPKVGGPGGESAVARRGGSGATSDPTGGDLHQSATPPSGTSGSGGGERPRISTPASRAGAARGTALATSTSGGGTYALGRGRQVVVKARYRRHSALRRGGRQRVLAAHVRYLSRPNATGLERHEAFFDANSEAVDASAVPTLWARDRLHWRMILSPEEGDQLDLRRYVRDYAARLEHELDTPLEWVAVTHHNTDSPHAHLLVRGRRDDGRELHIPRAVVSERLREWAEELATRQLDERSIEEADQYLTRLAESRRPTPLDVLLARLAVPNGTSGGGATASSSEPLDVQISRCWTPELAGRNHLERRLRTLVMLGLAEQVSPPFRRAKWRLHGDFVAQLNALAERDLAAGTDTEAARLPAESAADRRAETHQPAADRPALPATDQLPIRSAPAPKQVNERARDDDRELAY